MATFRPANIWYVSKDAVTTPTGGPIHPYPSITAALAQVNALPVSAGSQTIVVYPGAYVESPVITRGYVNITSFAPSPSSNAVTTIVGSITIAINAGGSLYANQVAISNLTVAQPASAGESLAAISDSSTVPHSVLLSRCSISGKNRLVSFAHLGSDSRLNVEDCQFYQLSTAVTTPLSLILVSAAGGAIFQRCNITGSKDAELLEISGNGALWEASLCNFQSTTTSAAPPPIVAFRSAVVFPTVFTLCAVAYTSFGTTTRPASSCGIAFGGGVAQTLFLTNTYFLLLGTEAYNDAVHIEDTATHQVYSTQCYAFPNTACVVNTPFAKLVPLQVS
jgi:hypothetical protein